MSKHLALLFFNVHCVKMIFGLSFFNKAFRNESHSHTAGTTNTEHNFINVLAMPLESEF